MSKLHCDGPVFRDGEGRMIILRGVNLGGDSKVPANPDRRSFLPDDFSDHRTVSFVGRPFPLADAASHLRRLAHWGFNCLRLLTTWEAIEHAGPGIHDEAYLDYLEQVCRLAGQYGFYVFIDFHQDVWSRMSGGDGAPGWTFEAAGLDFNRFNAADAAHVMQHRYDYAAGGLQASYPLMSWSANYHAPANAIMWTLFFAGADFAPSMRCDGSNIQHYLQSHYLAAMSAIARRVVDQPHVIGFDTLNEPSEGWIGRSLEQPVKAIRGLRWTPLDGLAAAAGIPRRIPRATLGTDMTQEIEINASRTSIWIDGRTDPFRDEGVWDIDRQGNAIALKPDYFREIDGRRVSPEADYMVPFFARVSHTVTEIREDWLIFAEVSPFSGMYEHGYPSGMPGNSVNAVHWYDYNALVSKTFSSTAYEDLVSKKLFEGPEAIEDSYVTALGRLQRAGDSIGSGVPSLIGECGYQFDMNNGDAYRRYAMGERGEDVWRAQIDAQELMYNALDRLLLNSTQWNYTATNRNDPMIGDGWNQEDLSIFSLDQLTDESDPDSGGRAIEGFCRPFVRRTQGRLVSQLYKRSEGLFEARLEIDIAIEAMSEIYVPARIFGPNPIVTLSTPQAHIDFGAQILRVSVNKSGLVDLVIRRGEA